MNNVPRLNARLQRMPQTMLFQISDDLQTYANGFAKKYPLSPLRAPDFMMIREIWVYLSYGQDPVWQQIIAANFKSFLIIAHEYAEVAYLKSQGYEIDTTPNMHKAYKGNFFQTVHRSGLRAENIFLVRVIKKCFHKSFSIKLICRLNRLGISSATYRNNRRLLLSLKPKDKDRYRIFQLKEILAYLDKI